MSSAVFAWGAAPYTVIGFVPPPQGGGCHTAMIFFLRSSLNNLKNVFLTFFEILDTGNTIFGFEKFFCKSGFCVNPVYCVLGTKL